MPQLSTNNRNAQSPHGLFSPYSTSSSPPTGVTQVVSSQHSDSGSASSTQSSSRASVQRSTSPREFRASFHTPSLAASYPSGFFQFNSTGHFEHGDNLSPLSSPRLSSSPQRRRTSSSSSLRRTTSPRTVPLPHSPDSGHNHEISMQPVIVMVPMHTSQGGCRYCEGTNCERCQSRLSDRPHHSHPISPVHVPGVVYERRRDPRSPFIRGTSVPVR